MLESISTTQPNVAKLAADGSETPNSAKVDQKHLDYQKQQSSSSMKANTTNDDSFQVVTKRRNQKQQSKLDGKVTKASSSTTGQAKSRAATKRKSTETDKEVATLTAEEEHRTDDLASDDEVDNSNSDPSFIGGYSKKKQQYLEQEIKDRSGVYKFDEDPSKYKKARKRLQNRESAVRSRMKKREEMNVLEEQVRELNRQKAAIEASNEELKRQNKYWEELFAKQQLAGLPAAAPPAPVVRPLSVQESQDLTQPSHELSNIEDGGNLSDPSYENLEMTRGEFLKRQKLSMDDAFYGSSGQKASQAVKDQIPVRNISFGGGLRPAFSEGDDHKDLLPDDDAPFNTDDFVLERRSSNGPAFGNSTFFGLAVMCGSIGMASFMSASSPAQATGTTKLYSGAGMAGTEYITKEEPVSIKHQTEDFEANYIEQTPSQNMLRAFELILQALMTMPVMTYISFALSLLFMVMWLINPGSYLSSEEKKVKMIVRKSKRTSKPSSQSKQRRVKAQTVRQN